MKHLITIILCLLFSNISNAAELEIKAKQQAIKLPYWASQNSSDGAVIIIKGGATAQWSEALVHLSQLLAERGWSTVLLNTTTISSSWLDLLPEVISTLRQKNNKRIVLLHYGEKMNITLDYFKKPQGKSINGLILLSAYDDPPLENLENIRFPILDIVGQFDYDFVKNQYAERLKILKSPTYLSLIMPGADNSYDYARELLSSFMVGWMLKTDPPEVFAPPIKLKQRKSNLGSYIEPINKSAQIAVIELP